MEQDTLKFILDSLPFPIVFVDMSHTIRFLNKTADFRYHQRRGYENLIGKNIFDCHNDTSKDEIIKIVEKLKNHGNDVFLKITNRNERLYVTAVRNDNGDMIGYYERYEPNYKK